MKKYLAITLLYTLVMSILILFANVAHCQNIQQDTCVNKMEYSDVKESVNTLLNLYDLEIEKNTILEQANVGLKLSINNYASITALQNEKLINAEKTIGLQQYDIKWLEEKNTKLKRSRWYFFTAGVVTTIVTIVLIK